MRCSRVHSYPSAPTLRPLSPFISVDVEECLSTIAAQVLSWAENALGILGAKDSFCHSLWDSEHVFKIQKVSRPQNLHRRSTQIVDNIWMSWCDLMHLEDGYTGYRGKRCTQGRGGWPLGFNLFSRSGNVMSLSFARSSAALLLMPRLASNNRHPACLPEVSKSVPISHWLTII